MDLSVLIVNWNTRDLLRECLRSVRAAISASGLSVETLVVDNASADGSAAMTAAEFPEVSLLANAENRNYAGGNNQGLERVTGDFILLLNPDTELPPDGLAKLVADLRENPGWGAVSPALIYPDGRLQESVRGFPTPQALTGEITGVARLAPASAWGAYRLRNLPEDRPTLVDQPMASAFMVRKAALDQVGHFDPDFPLFFNDVDLCFRLKRAGWEIAYDPRVRVVHVGGASTRQVRPEAIRRSHAGLIRFYEKHYRGRIPAPAYAFITTAIRAAGWLRAELAAPKRR